MERSGPAWWTVIIAAFLTVSAGAAAFYIIVFGPGRDAADQFLTMSTLGFGAILGVMAPQTVAAVMARRRDEAPPNP